MNHDPSSDSDDGVTKSPSHRALDDARESYPANPSTKPSANPKPNKEACGSGSQKPGDPGTGSGSRGPGADSRKGRSMPGPDAADDADAASQRESQDIDSEVPATDDRDGPVEGKTAAWDQGKVGIEGKQRQAGGGQGTSPAKPRDTSSGVANAGTASSGGRGKPEVDSNQGSSGQKQKQPQEQAPGRPGEGKKADRNGKTYEGKTGVSGETGGTDDES